MGQHPYQDLPADAFWRTGVCADQDDASLGALYRKRFEISDRCRIATAGSCFAQHLHRALRQHGYRVLDLEPAPPGLAIADRQRFGYDLYSARYGNVYSVRQLLQLAREAAGLWTPANLCWPRGEHWIDALRPGVEPEGLETAEEVLAHRAQHLERVRQLLEQFDLFVFTLGLTETWQHRASGTVYPLAPGTQGGVFDPAVHGFHNSRHGEVLEDLHQLMQVLAEVRQGRSFRLLLTVSPVPLTATASGEHVLAATVRSKATLRSAVAEFCDQHDQVAYFPSYELIHHPNRSDAAFAPNKRSIEAAAVQQVMRVFLKAHSINSTAAPPEPKADDLRCEEALLEQFAP